MDKVPSEDSSQAFSESALPIWGGGIGQPQKHPRAKAECLLAWEKEEKDNFLMGTEPLLFKMNHTQLDEYCKNLQIFLFINPSVCRALPSSTCSGFLFSSTCYWHSWYWLLQRTSEEPASNTMQSPQQKRGLQKRGWRASQALGFSVNIAGIDGSLSPLGAQHTAA